MEIVALLKYLERILMASGDDWMEMLANLQKSQKQWACISWVLGWEGADTRTSGNFYKALVQLTLPFGTETWVMSPRIVKNPGGFHHRVALQMELMRLRQDTTGMWVYPPLYTVMMTLGLEEVDTYVPCFHNTVTQYIVTCLIMDLYLASERCPELRVK